MSWINISIGDLGRVVTGDTPPKKNPEFYGGRYPFIKPTDMKVGDRHTHLCEDYYSDEAFEKYKKKLIPPGATAVVTIGSIGQKITFIDRECFVNQAVNAVIPDVDKYDPLFVFYLLKNNLNLVKCADTGASSGRENVSKSNFSSLSVCVPECIEEQRKIGFLLGTYDDLIEVNSQHIQLLEESARLLYREWFIKFRFPNHEQTKIVEGIPEGWECTSLNRIAYVNNNSFKTQDLPELIEYIDIASVSPGMITETTTYRADEAPGRARRKVVHGDIIWSCVRPNRKSYALIWQPEVNLVASTGFAVISVKNISFTYLYHALTTDDFVSFLEANATGAAYPAVTAKTFLSAEILLPDKKTLALFDQSVLPIFEQIEALTRQNVRLRQARDALLPKLMSGELRC